jgi:hypothetical protein
MMPVWIFDFGFSSLEECLIVVSAKRRGSDPKSQLI